MNREWPGVLAHADQRGRDAFAFGPIASRYLEVADDLVVRTPYSRTVITVYPYGPAPPVFFGACEPSHDPRRPRLRADHATAIPGGKRLTLWLSGRFPGLVRRRPRAGELGRPPDVRFPRCHAEERTGCFRPPVVSSAPMSDA